MDARFRFDFNSPYAYLAASRIDGVLGADISWEPIAFAFLLRAHDREPWSFHQPTRSEGQRAWAAQRLGGLRAFCAAAYERNFVDGHGLNDAAMLGDVCERAGLDAGEVRAHLDGYGRDRLRTATDAAIAEGVVGVPTVTVGTAHFWGDDRLEDAAAALG